MNNTDKKIINRRYKYYKKIIDNYEKYFYNLTHIIKL
jgi:hypothetical protein